ncbi:apolipoprotein B-100 [Ambystoma mexicanum]|uniref:apolipoprotein B-100 n=1 Tax=Ambystoma mexicanum TaxID=8296 RepID=UPI0037E8770B
MGTSKLWLLVLLATSGALAQDDAMQSQTPSCLKDATRFKNLRKYVYNYEAESTNGVPGTADSQSGSKISCKVELEVPQLCSFILRVSQCTLLEVYGVNPEGKALLKRSKNSEEFASAMSENELKFSIPDGEQVLLYPHKDEAVNVLNIKRGIISALVVPLEKEEAQVTASMDTVFGKCSSEVEFKNKKGATALEVTINRNLKTCDQFTPIRSHVSPLALIKGLNAPLSTLVSSSQSCQYSIDPKRKHVSDAVCTEKHLFLPFSHKNQYGIMAQVTQTLKLEDMPKINSRFFDEDTSLKQGLALDKADTKSPFQRGDNVVKILEELQKLSGSQQQRAKLFHKYVTALRGLHSSTLSTYLPLLMQSSSPITLQALGQCGTIECADALFQTLRSENASPVLADAVTYALGLLTSPGTKTVQEILKMAQYQQSRASFYALSHVVNNFYADEKTVTQEVRDVAQFMVSLLDNECSGDEDKTYLTLKAIGNMGNALDDASPEIKAALLKCVRSQKTSISVQKAAIQAFRKMAITDEAQVAMVQVFQDANSPVEKRLAAYLMLMKNPAPSDLLRVTRALQRERSEQVKSFVASHIANILNSEAPEAQELKAKVLEALKGSEVPTAMDFRKFSQNYQFSKSVTIPGLDDAVAAKVEGNLIFDGVGYMPEEAMLQTTLNVFGHSHDMFELGFDGKGFEPTMDALFGENGFFPDSGMKALYWVDGKVPEKLSAILFKWFGVSKDNNQNQDFARGMILNIEKLIKEVRASESPEAKAYLRILGQELGYMKLNDFKVLGNMLLKSLHASHDLPGQIAQALSRGTDSDMFLHYIFMDNDFDLPTGAGFQLQVSLSGIVTPGAKAGMKIQTKNMQAEVSVKPAVAVEFVTHVGVHIPSFARNGVQMNTNMFHESGVSVSLAVKEGQIKFSIPSPKRPTQLFSFSNKLHLVSTSKTEAMPSIIENRESWSSCKPFFPGLKFCTNVAYSNASSIDAAPYYPLTGETKFELEIQPTLEVKEYTATANYELKKDGGDLIDTLKFTAQAEGSEPCEATLTLKYNRNKVTLSSDVQIPKFDVDLGVGLRVNDESSRGKKNYAIILDVNNQKVPEIALTGRIRYDGRREAVVEGVVVIPRLLTEGKAELRLQHSPSSVMLQLDTSAAVCKISASQRTVFTYDNDKLQVEWNTGSNTDLKTMVSKLRDLSFSDLSAYPKAAGEYANDVLDQKVANTDMTLRHIVSQSLVATNNWLQETSKDIPYATTLQEKLSGLQELNLRKMGLPEFTVPENLFLKSDGKVAYTFNKDSIIIDIPLPFAGKSSEQLRIPRKVRSPKVEFERLGLRLDSMLHEIPQFTIPESYPLRVPMLGVFSLSTNVYSNYYNWSASYTGGNTTKDVLEFTVDYKIRADCALDLLSYNVGENLVISYDQMNVYRMLNEAYLRHSLLEYTWKAKETFNIDTNPLYQSSCQFDVSSILGVKATGSCSMDGKPKGNGFDLSHNCDGQLRVASLYSKIGHTLTLSIDADTLETATESNLRFDSSYLQATNNIIGRYADASLDLVSTTDVQSGALKNTFSLSCKNRQLTLKSDTTGRYQNVAALNKVEMTLSGQMAAIRSEYQGDYKRNRFYTLLSGSLGSNGLELNADINLNNQVNRAAHKATLEINGNALSTSATTNVNFSPLTLDNELNAGIDASGATIKMTGNSRYKQNSAKVTIDGKAALTDLALSSTYQSTILGIDSKNLFNFKVNKDGLKCSNNLQGSYEEMRMECNHDLSLALTALSYTSKIEGTLSTGKSYKQSLDLQIQPYTLMANVENDFKYGDADLTNRGKFLLEPFKMNLEGDMRGAFKKDEIKHAYSVALADLTANFKSDTIANIQGSAYTHNVILDIAGLSASFRCSTNYACKSLRYTNVVRSVVAPFSLLLDAHTTGDGRLSFLGDHTGELYNKFLLRAELFSFSLSHDYRGSTGHICGSGKAHSTLIDNKINVLFTPSEQSSSWKLKTKLDNNGYSQDINAYNDAEKLGVNLKGQALVDFSLLDTPIDLGFAEHNLVDLLDLRDTVGQPQEFSISGSVKYDKNKDVHVINLPFFESLPVYFEQVRGIVLSALQSLQNYLKGINIDQVIRAYKSSLDRIPQQLNDYINTIDFEGTVNDAKERVLAFAKEYRMTAEDLENALENAKINFETAIAKLQDYLSELNEYLRQNVDIYELGTALESLINQIVEKLKELDKQYDISKSTIQTIQELQKFVNQLDINELGSAASAWAQDMEAKYHIKASILDNLEKLKSLLNNINAQKIAANIKKQLKAIKIQEYVEKFKDSIPIEKLSAVLEQIKNIVLVLLEDYDVTEKINAFAGKMQTLITTYEVEKHAQVLVDNFIKLVNQYKVKETVKKITAMFKTVDFKSCFEYLIRKIDEAVQEVKSYDYEKLVQDVNVFLDLMIKKIRSFDYGKFVDQANERIREITQKINTAINDLELPQKAEVLKEYMNDIKNVISKFLEQLGNTKLASIIEWFRDLLSSTSLNEMKKAAVETLEDVRDRIYRMDLQREFQQILHKLSLIYNKMVTHISEQWKEAAEQITALGVEYDLNEVADKINALVERGLSALMEATFQTPSFTVPFTDLTIPSVTINMNRLREITIPTRFDTPEFTFFNTFRVPSYRIDLNEIKQKIVRLIDQIMYSEFQWPSSEVYFKDFKMKDMLFADVPFPDLQFPELQLPEIAIPKLNLDSFQFPNIEIPEFQLPQIPHTVTVPTFGKLAGEFNVVSPFFTLKSSADLENTTISENTPEFVASLSALTKSKLEMIEFTLVADARVSAPRMAQLIFTESVKVSHKLVKVDHKSEVTFSGNYVQGKGETTASLHTEKNSAQLRNDIKVMLQRKITIDMNTRYSHELNIPEVDLSSHIELQNELNTLVEAGKISLLSSGKGNWKWACPNFSDEGTHESNIKFIVKGGTIEISGSNKVNDKYMKLDQNLKYNSGFLSFASLDIQSEAESQYVGRSVLTIQGSGQLDNLKAQLTATHNAELAGRATGTISNSFSFLVQPFEINLSTNNNGNLKVAFPMKLTGKIEFLNNYAFLLNSAAQQTSWQVNGRFNQYKYSHTISAGNTKDAVEARVAMNGEANLDFLNVPVTIPELQIPYSASKTPEVKDFSLWERTGLKNFLKTTKQAVDLNVNLKYKKNEDRHAIPFPLGTLYDTINQNMKVLNKRFEKERDNTIAALMDSYNKAKAEFEKYKVENAVNKVPRIFRITGYTIPLVNIEVSPFTAELPAFGYVVPKEIRTPSFMIPVVGFSVPTYTLVLPSLEMPVLHVPLTLRRLTLPRFKLPNAKNEIFIPAMGDLTYDFSFKSNVISLTTTAGLFNQTDISARFSSACTSVIEALQYKLDGTTSLTRQRGLKLATALSLKNAYVEGNHESSVTFAKKNIEASVTTAAKVNVAVLKVNFKQELAGNTKSKPTVSSKINLDYELNDATYGNAAKGTIENTFSLEGLSNYLSVETSTKGDIGGVLFSKKKFSGKLSKEATAYLNANGARSTVKLEGNTKIDGLGSADLKESLAIEASLRRVFAVWDHTGKNNFKYLPSFSSKGTQTSKATFELSPCNLQANVQLQADQPNTPIDAISQNLILSLTCEKQTFAWKGVGNIYSVVLSHDVQLANDKAEVRMDVAGSVQGHVTFLKSVILPVYDKSLWDILKFDVTTNVDKKQYVNSSASIVYTKNKEGYFFAIPVEKLTDGVVITIPQLDLQVPQWMRELPSKMSEIQLPDLTDFNIQRDMPSSFHIPGFQVPFTTLKVPSYEVDFSKIKVPKKLTIVPFDLSLPAMPKVRFPKVDVGARYLMLEEYKIPYFELTVPQFELTLPEYTLPKRIEALDLNEMAKKIADFELPTITIPEQKIEFPPLKLNLPGGLFIPAFGALTGSVKVATPIYTASWSATLRNATNSLEASIDATCSSTLQFLEYDLDATATSSVEGSTLKLIGKGTLSHVDLSADWQEDVTFAGLRLPSHSIRMDIKSPTFADLEIRCQHEGNKLSSSVSSPSAGTLGLLMEKDTSIIRAKVYSRTPTSPGKDLDILKSEVSLKNPEQIQIKTSWKEKAATDILMGMKDRLPQMSDAVYNVVNKYHNEHLGMDLKSASLKMKNSMENGIDKAYKEAAKTIDEMDQKLRSAARKAGDRYQDVRSKAEQLYQDQAPSMDYMQIRSMFLDTSITVLREYQKQIQGIIDAAIQILKVTKFQLPGQTKQYTGEELYTMAVEQVIQKMQQYLDALIQYVSELEITVPGTDKSIQGKQVIEQIKKLLKELQQRAKRALNTLKKLSWEEKLKQINQFFQANFERVEGIFQTLKDIRYENINMQAQEMYKNVMHSDYARQIEVFALDLKEITFQMREMSQDVLKDLSEKLQQLLDYIKALRADYWDPTIVGWSVKYYEIEEKVLELLQQISLKDLYEKYIQENYELVLQLISNVKELLEKYGKEYYDHVNDLVTDAEGKGRKKISELSSITQEKIRDWSATAKENAAEYNDFLKAKLQEAYIQLAESYDRFIAEAKRLIDLSIEKYNSLIEYILQLLQNMQTAASGSVKPYISTRKGELKVDVPHPFKWQSFNELPQLRDDFISKKMEIVQMLIREGIDESSKKWEGLQQFIDEQLTEGKLSVQQIIENIQQSL